MLQVEGPKGKGVVNVHMVRPTPSEPLEYKSLTLEVPGETLLDTCCSSRLLSDVSCRHTNHISP